MCYCRHLTKIHTFELWLPVNYKKRLFIPYRFDEFEVLIFIMQYNTIKGLFIPMALDVKIFSRDY